MAASLFKARTIYSFRPWTDAIAVLGSDFTNATVLAVLDRETAEIIGVDTFATYAQLLPYLPSGTSKDASETEWIRLRLSSGKEMTLPVVCINPDTVTESQMTRVVVAINAVNATDVPLIKQALISNGFENIEIVSS